MIRSSLFTARRLSVYYLFVLAFSLPLAYFIHDDGKGALESGDFPAFYTAAVLVHQGESSFLYDHERQRQISREYWLGLGQSYLLFAYPPYVAKLLSPLAFFGPSQAKFLYAVLQLIALYVTVVLLVRIEPSLCRLKLEIIAYLLACPAVLLAVFGGQNVALSMLCYSFAVYFLQRESRFNILLAGFCLGCWAFKPNLGVPAVILFCSVGGIWILAGAMIPWLCYYFIGVFMMSWSWPVTWLEALSRFSVTEQMTNQYQMISLIDVFRAVGLALELSERQLNWFAISGWIFAIAVFIASFFICLFRQCSDPKQLRLSLLLIAPTLILSSPHVLFYEVGVLFIPLVLFSATYIDQLKLKRDSMVVLFFVIIATGLRKYFAVQPLILLTAVVYFVFLQKLRGIGRLESKL